jgi:hypothetical protein
MRCDENKKDSVESIAILYKGCQRGGCASLKLMPRFKNFFLTLYRLANIFNLTQVDSASNLQAEGGMGKGLAV